MNKLGALVLLASCAGCAMQPGRQFHWSGHSESYTDAAGVTWSCLGVQRSF